MAFAQVGPLTAVFEAAATAVGAGVVLGSVLVGSILLVVNLPRREIEGGALVGGYAGGGVGALIALTDAILRYGG